MMIEQSLGTIFGFLISSIFIGTEAGVPKVPGLGLNFPQNPERGGGGGGAIFSHGVVSPLVFSPHPQ